MHDNIQPVEVEDIYAQRYLEKRASTFHYYCLLFITTLAHLNYIGLDPRGKQHLVVSLTPDGDEGNYNCLKTTAKVHR